MLLNIWNKIGSIQNAFCVDIYKIWAWLTF